MEELFQWIDKTWVFAVVPVSFAVVLYTRSFKVKARSSSDSNSIYSHDPELQDLLDWSWLSMPLYALHQFEESGYTVYGHRSDFIQTFNETNVHGIFIHPRSHTIANLVQAQGMLAAYAWASHRTGNPLFGALVYAYMGVHAATHILPKMKMQRRLDELYEPGLAQTVFLMAPVTAHVIYKYVRYYYKKTMLSSSSSSSSSFSGVLRLIVLLLVCLFFALFWHHAIMGGLGLKLAGDGTIDSATFLVLSVLALIIYPVVADRVLCYCCCYGGGGGGNTITTTTTSTQSKQHVE